MRAHSQRAASWRAWRVGAGANKGRPQRRSHGRAGGQEMPCAPEHDEQVALLQWTQAVRGTLPEASLLFAIPNGGARNPITAARLKAEGVKAGVPDLFLPVARGVHHGLFVEMKRTRGGRVSPAQTAWLTLLRAQGFRAEVCCGWVAAREVISNYLAVS